MESTLERTITRGCATALDIADDTNNSAADFRAAAQPPRNNAATPTEKGSARQPADQERAAPNTKIKKRPKNRSGDSPDLQVQGRPRPARPSSASSTTRSSHKCKSPKTYHGLDAGKHTFKVEAIDASGIADTTPAKDKFKILP